MTDTDSTAKGGLADAPTERRSLTFKRKGRRRDADAAEATVSVVDAEDVALAKLGYRNEFRREFGNLATIRSAVRVLARG